MTASIWNPGSTTTPSSPETTPHLFTPGTASAPGLAFVGDVDTGIFQEAAGRVSVGTNGSKRVTVDELGNVLFEGAKISFGSEVSVTAAATIDLGAYTTNTLVVSGAPQVITSFGVNYKGFFCLRFTTQQLIQHGALLQCPSSVNYLVPANTTVFVYPKAGGGWIVSGNSSVAAEWVPTGTTPIYVTATTFTLAGDWSTVLTAGRRLQITINSGTKYGAVVATSVSTSITTVTVVMDSSTPLDNTITVVNYGFLNPATPSVPSGTSSSAAAIDLFSFYNLI